jgi:hypothetical protein
MAKGPPFARMRQIVQDATPVPLPKAEPDILIPEPPPPVPVPKLSPSNTILSVVPEKSLVESSEEPSVKVGVPVVSEAPVSEVDVMEKPLEPSVRGPGRPRKNPVSKSSLEEKKEKLAKAVRAALDRKKS